MSFMNLSKHCLAAALLLFAAVLYGAPPTMEQLKARIADATLEKYPNADTVTLYDGEEVVYQPDGLHGSTNVFCIKVLTEAGRKQLRKMSFDFNGEYGAYSVTAAKIVKPNGAELAADVEKSVSTAISTRSMGINIYSPEDKVLTLALPQVEIGDTVVVTLTYKSFKTPFPGIFSDVFLLQGGDPVVFAEVSVDAPEELPLRSVAIKSAVAGTVTRHAEKRENGRIVYRWTAENVPQIIPEPNMPPLSGVAQRLLISTAKEWPEISRWYYRLCRPRLDAVDDEMKTEVAKLVAGSKTDRDKAMALFQFVSQKIRYSGVKDEDRAPGFEPHDVKDTFRQRHGVCRDKAGLLVAMLELAGLKAYPVLFHASSSTVDDEVPASRFNHAIVAWETSPGQYQLMDPTCETTQDFFPAYLANQSYLVATPKGDILRRSPSPPPENNALDIATVAAFDADGTLKGKSTFKFSGYNDIMYRDALSRRRETMRQLFCRLLQRAVPGAKIAKFAVSPEDVRDMSKPLTVEITYFAPGALSAPGAARALRLPELSQYFGAAEFMFDDISLDSRRHPLRFDTTAVNREKIALTLPGSVRILSLPPESQLAAPGAKWTRKVTSSGNTVDSETGLAVDRLEISPEQYPALRELRRRRIADAAALPLVSMRFAELPTAELAKAFPDADSFLEDERRSIKVAPEGSRIEIYGKRRILTYAGVKKNSELRFTYDPRYEDVKIEASVTSPDGKKQELSPKHIIDMDAAWVASAPRYPKARTRIAVLPSVQIGSLVETKIVFSSKETVFFHFAMQFLNHTPAARRELAWEVSDPGKIRYSPPPAGANFSLREQGNSAIGTMSMTDIAAIPEELSQPDLKMFAPTVFLSNGNYRDYATAWDKRLRELAATPSPAADLLYSQIDRSGPMKTVVTGIRDAVAKKLRSAGPDLDDMLLRDLTPPERTLQDGYGNSADRAVVIAALLDRAGIKYEFVAVSRLPYLRENVQLLRRYPRRVFEDVLVFIPKLNVYLNDTNQYAALGSTPHDSLIALDLGSGRLTKVRPRHRMADGLATHYDIVIAEDGSATVGIVREYLGTLFNKQNHRCSEMTPEERRMFCENLAAELLPEAKLVAAKCDFSKYPGRIELNFRIDRFAVPVDGKLMFDLPGCAELVRAVNAVDGDRRTPALRKEGIRRAVKYRIAMPRGYGLEPHRRAPVDLGRRGSGCYTERSKIEPDVLHIDSLLVLPIELIRPCDYVELMDLQRDMSRHFRRRIVLVKKSEQGS